jgi:hypothetical protein
MATFAHATDQAVAVEHGMNGALGRHSDVTVKPPDQQLAEWWTRSLAPRRATVIVLRQEICRLENRGGLIEQRRRLRSRGSTEAIIVAIDPGQFALAAAEGSAFEAELIERFSSRDQALFDLARSLALECADGYPNGALFWNGMASTFIDGLLVRHTSKFKVLPRGALDEQVLGRIRDYVVAHMDEPIETGALAKIAGRSPFSCRLIERIHA